MTADGPEAKQLGLPSRQPKLDAPFDHVSEESSQVESSQAKVEPNAC